MTRATKTRLNLDSDAATYVPDNIITFNSDSDSASTTYASDSDIIFEFRTHMLDIPQPISVDKIIKTKKSRQKYIDRIAWKAEAAQRLAKRGNWK